MYYENRGNKKVLEQMEYTTKNVEITEKKIQMAPNSTKLVMHPLEQNTYNFSVKSNTLFS